MKEQDDLKKEMLNVFSKEENALFQLIRCCLFLGKSKTEELTLTENEWIKIIRMAEKHGVLSILYEELCDNCGEWEYIKKKVELVAVQVVLQQYRLLFECKFLTSLLKENGIETVILKGVAAGALYPVPELRKSGDIDLLLVRSTELNRAKEILENAGYCMKKEQPSLHHICFLSKDGVELELHTMLAEPFDSEKTNDILKNIMKEMEGDTGLCNIMGVELPVLRGAYYPFELLLHMLQHFLRAGFGLKLLCDWVLYWQKEPCEKERTVYLELVERTGIKGFSDMITMVCVRLLGLEESKIHWMNCSKEYPVEEFVREILDAEEFGKSNVNRMVVMRGTGIWDYIREFHHQMRLNFPKAGKCFLLWPMFWCITLFRFLRNNRKIRNTSAGKVLREATRRSRLMKKIRLFQ